MQFNKTMVTKIMKEKEHQIKNVFQILLLILYPL